MPLNFDGTVVVRARRRLTDVTQHRPNWRGLIAGVLLNQQTSSRHSEGREEHHRVGSDALTMGPPHCTALTIAGAASMASRDAHHGILRCMSFHHRILPFYHLMGVRPASLCAGNNRAIAANTSTFTANNAELNEEEGHHQHRSESNCKQALHANLGADTETVLCAHALETNVTPVSCRHSLGDQGGQHDELRTR